MQLYHIVTPSQQMDGGLDIALSGGFHYVNLHYVRGLYPPVLPQTLEILEYIYITTFITSSQRRSRFRIIGGFHPVNLHCIRGLLPPVLPKAPAHTDSTVIPA